MHTPPVSEGQHRLENRSGLVLVPDTSLRAVPGGSDPVVLPAGAQLQFLEIPVGPAAGPSLEPRGEIVEELGQRP